MQAKSDWRFELKVFLAGRVAVQANGVLVEEGRFPGRQGRLMFAYLVAEQGRPVPRDELAEALWGSEPPATWDKALTVVASKLRGLLSEHGIDGASALTGAFGCYRLVLPEGTWIDVIVAADAAGEAEEALAAGDLDHAKVAAALAESLVREPFLPGEAGQWVEGKRRELADVRGRALSALADACLRSGAAADAAKWVEQTIALEPFRETGYRRLMEAHVAAGNRAEALQVYERCRLLLAEELGTYPSPETEFIYRGLLEAPAARGTGVVAAKPPPSKAVPVGEVEPEPRTGIARRIASRRRIAAAAAVALLAAATVTLSAASGKTRPTPVVANAVGLIDARGGHVSGQVSIGQAPTAVAVGEGAVWAANATAGTVSRIDPVTRSVRQTITVGASPSGIATGGGGVWVANHDDNTVSWINPQSNTVVKAITVGAGPTAVVHGYGSIWVTNSDDRTVTRIDADTGHVTKTIRSNAVGRGIAVGGGSVWVTDEATRSVIGIDPSTNTVVSKADVGAGPIGVAYGAGSLWVANALDDTVSRVDASTLAAAVTIPVRGGPSAVGFTDGAVWVSVEFGSRVIRIDPQRGVVVGSTPIGNRPEGLAADDSGVWVAVQSSGEGHRGGRLVSLDGAPSSIDPAQGPIRSVTGADPAYETLTSLRHAGGAAGTQVVPNLAAALPLATAGGRSYTFRLRPGIRYSDGRPLRAVDFRRGLARALWLDVGSNSTTFTQPFGKLVGAAGCIAHRRCDLSRSVIVDGSSTLTFRLPTPHPRFFLELAFVVPVPAGTPLRDVATRPVPATGPYKVGSFVPGKVLTLVRNPYFHVWSGAARPDGYPDEIVYRTVGEGEEGAAVRDVLAGRADLVTVWDQPAGLHDVAALHPLQTHAVPLQATEFVFLNVRRPPFDDFRVRRALNYAVDRKHVAALQGVSFARPTCQAVPPTVSGYQPYCPYTVAPDAAGEWRAPDLPKARELIRASGTRGKTIVLWSAPLFQREARYLVGLLRRLGYRARLHEMSDWNAYYAALNKTPSAQAGFIIWFVTPLAVDMLSTTGCRFQPNWARFCNPRVDAQVARLEKAEPADPSGTAGLAAKIDREIMDEAPVVPLFTPRFVDVTSGRVGNYQASNGAVLLDQLWVR